ncbi:hypothetical protein [Xanthomonas arboricola]|uniref:Uncharacterized protein n=1 Tax=Xanthomonas arboricola pv. pruni TaxID=69929 RepID=A0ACC6V8V3_9XANT
MRCPESPAPRRPHRRCWRGFRDE